MTVSKGTWRRGALEKAGQMLKARPHPDRVRDAEQQLVFALSEHRRITEVLSGRYVTCEGDAGSETAIEALALELARALSQRRNHLRHAQLLLGEARF